MAPRKKKRSSSKYHVPKWAAGVFSVAVVVLGLLGVTRTTGGNGGDAIQTLLNALDSVLYGESSTAPPDLPSNGKIKVYDIDVGQGESILVTTDTKSLLIDAGENDKGDEVIAFLSQLGIEKLDYVIATHPHSDHIGGMDTVLKQIPTGQVLFGEVPDSILPTTKTYNDLLNVITDKHIKLKVVSPGDTYDLGSGALLTILGPTEKYSDLNNCSVVSRLDFGETSFIFDGDQEQEAEKDLLKIGANLDADVMSMGHHGSHTASCDEYFAAVSPDYSYISCGKGNKYGHPHDETLTLLDNTNTKYYRTDINGNLTFTSDGKKIIINTQK